MPRTWEEASLRIRPAVRPVSSVADGSKRGTYMVRRSLAPFVKLCFVVDFDHAIGYVSERNLSTWQVDFDTLKQAARDNLLSDGLDLARSGLVTSVLGPEGYVSSWLAVPRALLSAVDEAEPGVVVIAPGRDQLRPVSLADPDMLAVRSSRRPPPTSTSRVKYPQRHTW
jgi:hypothetical protein